eukprot:scaffold365806_cov18-Prasinocladus_malaysianus.AAC.1
MLELRRAAQRQCRRQRIILSADSKMLTRVSYGGSDILLICVMTGVLTLIIDVHKSAHHADEKSLADALPRNEV